MTSPMSRVPAAVFLAACGVWLSAGVLGGQAPGNRPGAAARPQIVPADRHDRSPALRDMRPIPPSAGEREPHEPLPVRRGPGRPTAKQADPARQTAAPTAAAPATTVNFEGVNNLNGVLPPDTNADVGPNHYVQWVNLSFAVYNRSGSVVYGPADGRTLWKGFGGACEARNDGDPIALYDEHADRWLMTQFALPNYPSGPYYQCIAVSQTGDPTGAYYRYQYSFNKLNDYPKFGVWRDGYYMSINQFSCGLFSCSWAGQGVAAFDRQKMLAGAPANMIYFDMATVDSSLGGMLPADGDGPEAPVGAPNYFVQFDDDAWGYSPDQLQIWQFQADWATPLNSKFTKKATLPTAAFDSNMCGGSRNCIPQGGTTRKLDAIADRVMYRLQYRNFGTYETLVTNHTVDVTGTDQAGVRWYEIRNPGGTPSIYQQGTFAPDANHRWMGSAAMDASGNIALGYNVSNTGLFPRISFTGRLAGDPLGQMTVGEGDVMLGSGGQTHSASRWGDYSMLAVDPTDGCTFWYTTEYYAATTSASWRTRVGAFKLPGCSAVTPAPPADPSSLSAAAVSTSQIDLSWTDNSSNESGFLIERCQSQNCSTFSQIDVVGANVTTYSSTGLAAGTWYGYRVRAYNGAGNSGYSNTAQAQTPSAPPPPADMHVDSMTGTGSPNGKAGWKATVTIGIIDSTPNPVSGATVTGSWSNGYSGSASCTTGTGGTCSVSTGKINNNVTSVTFTVTAVTHPTLGYNAGANRVTSVVVSKP